MKDLRTLLKSDFTEMTLDERLTVLNDRMKNYEFHRNWLENHKQLDGRSSECRYHREAKKAAWELMCKWINSIGIETQQMPEEGERK